MSPFNPDPQNRYPSPRSDSGQARDDERVIEAEIIHVGCDDGRGQWPYGRSCRGGYGQEQFRGSRSPWNGGLHFQTIWTSGCSRQAGLAPGITLALIIIAGIERVVIRNTETEYSVVHVEDWVREDDSLPRSL